MQIATQNRATGSVREQMLNKSDVYRCFAPHKVCLFFNALRMNASNERGLHIRVGTDYKSLKLFLSTICIKHNQSQPTALKQAAF